MFKLLSAWPWAVACGAATESAEKSPGRFKGVSVILVVDAVPGAEMKGVQLYGDQGQEFYGKSLLSRRTREIMSLGIREVPQTVRAVWRENPKPVWGTNGGIDYEGRIVGDYTFAVAARIPNEVLDEIRARGGGLRLKFRLKPDGVLFGWDIERSLPIPGCDPAKNATCRGTHFLLPGGDFLETRY